MPVSVSRHKLDLKVIDKHAAMASAGSTLLSRVGRCPAAASMGSDQASRAGRTALAATANVAQMPCKYHYPAYSDARECLHDTLVCLLTSLLSFVPASTSQWAHDRVLNVALGNFRLLHKVPRRRAAQLRL